MKNTNTINLYTLDEAEKIIDYRRRKEARKRRKELKQKLAFKGLSVVLIIISIIVGFVVEFDNGGCLVSGALGFIGLVMPFNMEISF